MTSNTVHSGFSSNAVEPVAEALRGFRAFIIDDSDAEFDGALVGGINDQMIPGSMRGVYKRDFVWGPGTNTATCQTFPASKRHDVIEPSCGCGFWAYTNGEHFLSIFGPAVVGVIEGWGRIVVGTDGFRATHARIVALCFPGGGEPAPGPDATIAPKSMRELFAEMAYAFSLAAHKANSVMATAMGVPAPKAPVKPAAIVNNAPSGYPWARDLSGALKAKVAALYPDIPVYKTVAAMQAAYPLSDLSALIEEPEFEEPELA